MAQELKKEHNGSDTASIGCGIFDFLKKKKQKDNHFSSEECSSDDEGRRSGGEKRKRKGSKEKIKEKISGKKESERDENTEMTDRVGTETAHSEKGNIMDKLKRKLPGLGQRKKGHGDGSVADRCHEDNSKEKKGVLEKIKEKISVGNNVEQQKPKEEYV